MSGLLGRLRGWLGSLFGRDADAGADPDRVCAVCGTAVDDPDAGCPLCGAHDLEPAGDAAAGTGATSDPDGGARPNDDAGDGIRGPERRSVEATTDDAVTRLRDVQDEAPPEADEPSTGDGPPRGDDPSREAGSTDADGERSA